MPTLADILAGIDSVVTPGKRRLADLMRNPLASAQQTLGLLDDRAKTFTNALRTSQEGGELARMNSVMAGLPQYRQASDYVTNALTNQVMNFAPIGATVWHGSPHKFDKFDSSKIGTGEGAQAQGHGLYAADLADVADGYRTRLSGGDLTPQELEAMIRRAKGLAATSTSEAAKQGYLNGIKQLEESGGKQGYLYKIDLPDEHIAKMLDWDKPLSQQPEVLNALTPEKMGLTLRPPVDSGFMAYVGSNGKPIGLQMKNTTPEKFREAWLKRLQEMGDSEGGAGRAFGYLGGTSLTDLAPAVSQAVRQAGIPGIRYLDQGSRGAGQGTSNYVVFPGNEGLLNILERNGKPIK